MKTTEKLEKKGKTIMKHREKMKNNETQIKKGTN